MRKLFAAVCAVLFVVGMVISLVLVNAENLLFKSETYKQILQTTGVYGRLPSLVAGQISAGPAARAVSADLAYLTAGDWQILIQTLLPPQQLRPLTEQTLDQAFDYLDGKSASITIPLAIFKQGFASNGTQAIKQILLTKPDCTPQLLLSLALGVLSGQKGPDATLCNPPAQVLSTVLPVLSQSLQNGVATLPDSLTIFNAADHPDLLPAVQRARLLMRLSFLVPLVLLAALTLLAVRSLRDGLRWWGLPLMAAGAGGLLTGYFGAPAAGLLLATQIVGIFPFLAPFVQAMPDVLSALVHAVTDPLMFQFLVILVVGTGFYCASILLQRQAAQR